MRTFIIIILQILGLATIQAQNPPSIKWKQFKTDHFKVIYPNGLDIQASYAAELLEKSYSLTTDTYNNKPKPIKLYLFNQSSISNGFVGLGPRRMVWYTTPSQQTQMLGNSDWFQTLAIHEFRHVLQFSKLDTNLVDFASTLMGDIGIGLTFNWAYPGWYFEGDAVYAETKYSNSGRGRMPSFTKGIYALEAENIRYRYQKAYLGSYKHYFPNIYQLGFVMTKHIIDNYGDSTYLKVIENSTNYPFLPSAFSYALKRQTGFNAKKTYYNCLDSMAIFKESINAAQNFTNLNTVNVNKNKHFTNYTYPLPYLANSCIVFKNGFNHSGELCILNDQTERKLTNINPTAKISGNDSKIVWNSIIPDVRWPEKSYSDIYVYDIQKDSKKRLTKKQRYFAPAISPNSKYISAIEYTDSMDCSLIIISTENGERISTTKAPIGTTYRNPSWNNENNQIVFTESKKQQNSIAVYNSGSKTIKEVASFGSENISNPIFYKNFILFNAPYNGIDAICAIDTLNRDHFLVATSKNGLYNPSYDNENEQLLVQNYTINGHKVVRINLDPSNWTSIPNNYFTQGVSANIIWYDSESNNIYKDFDISETKIQKSKKYHSFLNLPKIHSWMPYPATNGIGFGMFAGNELETTYATGGIEYYSKDQASRAFVNILYTALPLEIGINFSKGRLYANDSLVDDDFLKIDEEVIGGQLNLPLNISTGTFNNLINVYGGYDLVNQKKLYDFHTIETDLTLLHRGFDASFYKQMAYRNLMPKLGFDFSNIAYYNSGKTKAFKNRMTTKVSTYLPAPLNHGIKLSYGIETNNVDDYSTFIYQLDSDLEMIYGYNFAPFMMDKYTNLKAQYSLPLFYPDLAVWNLLYCKRIKSNLFFNQGQMSRKEIMRDVELTSWGAELHGEFILLNMPSFAIELGVRASYREYFDDITYEVMFMGVAF